MEKIEIEITNGTIVNGKRRGPGDRVTVDGNVGRNLVAFGKAKPAPAKKYTPKPDHADPVQVENREEDINTTRRGRPRKKKAPKE